jgi:heavy metal translocating P-type ATPase
MKTKQLSLRIEGMDCPSCVEKIEKSMAKLEGVRSVKVIFSAEKAIITYDTKELNEKEIKRKIKELGYKVSEEGINGKQRRRLELLHLSILGIGILVCWSGIAHPLFPFDIDAIVLVILSGIPISRSVIPALKAKSVTADVAMATGMVASMVIGQFLSAAVIGFFMLLAEFIDEFTKDKARAAIQGLVKMSPKTALIKRKGQEVEVSVEQVAPGDIVVVKSGGRIPIDGVVVAGHGAVNQAPITGESITVEKAIGDEVFAGTINQLGTLEIRVTKVGKDTTLARIIQLVEEAEKAKAPIQKVADRFASKFLPLVFLIAVLTFLFTKNITHSIAVIVVACPCAIALATPLAVVASVGNAAKKGIIIKGGIYLEELGKIDTVVIDKTGTLTIGKPKVVNTESFDKHNEREIIALAAIAEQHSEHPLADAILNKAKEYGIKVPEHTQCSVIAGKGVIATYHNQTIVLGSKELLREKKIVVPKEVEQYMRREEEEGKTTLLIAHDGRVCGAISVADVVKEEAKQAIKELKQKGIRVIMLTGDNPRTANMIANQVGIEEVFAEMLPEEKVEKVKDLIRQGRKVAMVGDGINDAPALAEAHVGIAMGAAARAIEVSDVVLMTDDLTKITETIRISKKAFNVIKQNLVSSVIFNILGMVLASTGILNPLMAAFAHFLPDFILFINSSRLIH